MKSNQSEQEQFDVGSVIYFISPKTEKVIPALVSEKIVRTSKAASRVTYILEIRSAKSTQTAEVDPNTTTLFARPEDVREFMIARTTKAIDELIAAAVTLSKQFSIMSTTEIEEQQATDDPIEVTLPDGQVAKLRM